MTDPGHDAPLDLLPPDVPVDLDNCAREPIHIPGRIQPRGVLLALRASDARVTQCSDTVAAVLGRPVDDVLAAPLADAVGAAAARAILDRASTIPDLRARNPLDVVVDVAGVGLVRMDAILHHAPIAPGAVPEAEPVLVVELEPVDGARPLTFEDTFQPVRGALADLDRAGSLTELYDVAVRHVRSLTGFDRVMLYHFDADYNGEVVAEARRDDLNAFLGLHYPASDIPPQARALYEKNWIRLIADVAYEPSLVVPTDDPVTGQPLDLTFSTLRSVSPIHVEYLQNMGVGASMSISLLRDGRLWGLIACHHYSGAHAPTYAARAAAEFLGSSLSMRLVSQVEDDRAEAQRRTAGVLAHLVARSQDDATPLAAALSGSPGLLELVPAQGAFVLAEGRVESRGTAPDDDACRRVAQRLAAAGTEIVTTDHLEGLDRSLADDLPGSAGLLAITLPGGACAVWLRDEVRQQVDWGGDPYNKAIARREGDTVRLSPRKSFERWREVVDGRSAPWTEDEVDAAATLRSHLVEALLLRGRRDIRAAEALQRSLLPATLPVVEGWRIEARYQPSDGGYAGGDWYDAMLLPGGRLAVVVGDVTGHGLAASATMGQLRNGLRALLSVGGGPDAVLMNLDALARLTLPGEVATVVVAVVDPSDGTVEYATAGHPPPLVVAPGSAEFAPRVVGAPVGVGDLPRAGGTTRVEPGGALVLYSDGLVEHRDESVRTGLERLRATFADGPAGPDDALDACRDPRSEDDATLIVVRRLSSPS
ncbi:PAS domain-containing protein [Sediminihabitans luteus]|uniref:PAS domain-containing protein n=1 Tax=Sediminihabitans luteus TaxID=1138585 RepID=A0A2M9D0V0_9CELL|nr:SpoIIE family protein phosphatase [Sediminihabitans luteus]PJJ77822.1 PAS domain-containing protein [Sediminihabitans luteus]GII99820.1 hypothetical protein Slu03_21980 [Sediminihabitans luteus]